MQPIRLLSFIAIFSLAIACKKDEDAPAPVAALSTSEVTSKTGRAVTTTFSVSTTAPGSLVITKTVNTDVDRDWETNGSKTVALEPVGNNRYEYEFEYILEDDDADKLIGFNFSYTDGNGQNVQKDLSINAITSAEQTIYSRQWKLVSKMWVSVTPNVSDLKDCETDDIFTWNADSTYSISYGTKACTFDGFNEYTKWWITEDETKFVMEMKGVFDGSVNLHEYTIRSVTRERIVLEQTVDLTDFGEPYTANEKFVYTYEPVN